MFGILAFLLLLIFLLRPAKARAAGRASAMAGGMDAKFFRALPVPALLVDLSNRTCRAVNPMLRSLTSEAGNGTSLESLFDPADLAALYRAFGHHGSSPRLMLRTRFGPMAVKPLWLADGPRSPSQAFLLLDPVASLPRTGRARLREMLSGMLFDSRLKGKVQKPAARTLRQKSRAASPAGETRSGLAHVLPRLDRTVWAALDSLGHALHADKIGVWSLTEPGRNQTTVTELACWSPRGKACELLPGRYQAGSSFPSLAHFQEGEAACIQTSDLPPDQRSAFGLEQSLLAVRANNGGLGSILIFSAAGTRSWTGTEQLAAAACAALWSGAVLRAERSATRPRQHHPLGLAATYPGILLWEVDAAGALLAASPALRDILGTGPGGQFLGKEFLAACEEQARRHGKFHAVEHALVTDNGQVCRLLSSGTLLRDRRGRLAGLRGYSVDISIARRKEEQLRSVCRSLARTGQRLKQYQDQAQSLGDQAGSADRAKDEFLANMGHEIRTPLHVISGMAHLALTTTCDPALKRYLEKIHAASASLLDSMNNVLELARLSEPDSGPVKRPFRLARLLEGIAAEMDRLCARGVQFTLRLDPSLPPVVVGDPVKLRQIISSLVHNAVKFTESGSVQVNCQTLASTEQEVSLALEIRDTGIGMRPEHVATLLQPFTQADGSFARTHGGMGVGLALARKLIDAMGGTFFLCSEPGRGTTASVQLTLDIHAARIQERGSAILAYAAENERRGFLAEILKDAARDLFLPESCLDALAALKKPGLGLVLVWLENEEEARRFIRSAFELVDVGEVPLVVLSPDGLPQDNELVSAASAWVPGIGNREDARLALEPWLPAISGKSGPPQAARAVGPDTLAQGEAENVSERELEELSRLLDEDDARASGLCARLSGLLLQMDPVLGPKVCEAAAVFEFSEAAALLAQLRTMGAS